MRNLQKPFCACPQNVPVRIKWCDDSNLSGRRELERVDHEEELHEVVVGPVRAPGLEDVDVLAPHVLPEGHARLPIGELLEVDLADADADLPGHELGQLRVGGAAKDPQVRPGPRGGEHCGWRLLLCEFGGLFHFPGLKPDFLRFHRDTYFISL